VDEGDIAGEVAIQGAIIPRAERFRYLGSIIQESGEIDKDINHWIRVDGKNGKIHPVFYVIGGSH